MRAAGANIPEVEHRNSPALVSRHGFSLKFSQGKGRRKVCMVEVVIRVIQEVFF